MAGLLQAVAPAAPGLCDDAAALLPMLRLLLLLALCATAAAHPRRPHLPSRMLRQGPRCRRLCSSNHAFASTKRKHSGNKGPLSQGMHG